MEIVWDRGEVCVYEVREELLKSRDVARNTVRTNLERMEEKGWLTHRVVGRTYFYSALVPREVSLGERVTDIVEKACGGRPEAFMNALLDHRGLSNDEIQRIRSLLDDAQEQQKDATRKKSSRNKKSN